MSAPRPLDPGLLHRATDPRRFAFATTAELAEPQRPLGQARAEAAVQFGLGIRRYGFNLYVLGPPGLGKHGFVRRFLEPLAAAEPTPEDWCYVHDFEEPRRARALRLPPGRGLLLARQVERLLRDLRPALLAAFDTEDYRQRRQLLEAESRRREEQTVAAAESAARAAGLTLLPTPQGLILAPTQEGEVMAPEDFRKLPAPDRERIEGEVARLREQLQAVAAEAPRHARAYRQAVRQLDRELAAATVAHLMEELEAAHHDVPAVLAYLQACRDDVLSNLEDFLAPAAEGNEPPRRPHRRLHRYEVNVFVDRDAARGAPVVYEDHPTLPNLVGRAEHWAEQGHLLSDHRLLKAGALHRANGGYLIVEAGRLLQQPLAWDELKRALRARQVRIESLAEAMNLSVPAAVEPEPIPLDVKVVLLGDRRLYHLLSELDPEFLELFKVAADLADFVERTEATEAEFAAHLGSLARREGLRALDAAAVARSAEHAARVMGDAERLSLDHEGLLDLLGEADHLAARAGHPAITASDVQAAIDAQTSRADRLREWIHDEIRRGTILIDTGGARVGQVNGLAVYQVGRYSFGRPSRISARVRLGSGQVLDIEREVALGGPIHSKGVLILAGFLGARFAAERPLSLSASLVFEQSYDGIEGDSASCAELLALLSAIAEVPLRQSIALTGSVDQQGQVQAIGGVNQKIEGFFDVCRARGLKGDEGVVIPAANVKHLMLRADVVAAAAEGRFRVWAVDTVDQAVEILTGLPAGEREGGGRFPTGTFNAKVEARLVALAERARDFARAALGKER